MSSNTTASPTHVRADRPPPLQQQSSRNPWRQSVLSGLSRHNPTASCPQQLLEQLSSRPTDIQPIREWHRSHADNQRRRRQEHSVLHSRTDPSSTSTSHHGSQEHLLSSAQSYPAVDCYSVSYTHLVDGSGGAATLPSPKRTPSFSSASNGRALKRYFCRKKMLRLGALCITVLVCSSLLAALFLFQLSTVSLFIRQDQEFLRSSDWFFFYSEVPSPLVEQSSALVDLYGPILVAGNQSRAAGQSQLGQSQSGQSQPSQSEQSKTNASSGSILQDRAEIWEEFIEDDDRGNSSSSIDTYVLQEELDFPLAYSILVYRDVKQVLLLLRAIYRRHNLYCIHVDAKASPDIHLFVRHWQKHLPNLIVVSKPVSVVHSTMSTLLADLLCMKELLTRSTSWKYFINLTGQEFPRKTNLELVRILNSLKGSNLMNREQLTWSRVTKRLIAPPPFNITLYKGAVHVIVTRAFCHYVLHDQRAIKLLKYLNNTVVPDESFFSTLNHNPHLQAPGAYLGDEYTGPSYPYVNRLKSWSNEENQLPCQGVYRRLICIWGDDDFPTLTKEADPTLFINKFIVSINGRLFKNISSWFWQRQFRIYANPSSINISFYQQLPQIANHI